MFGKKKKEVEDIYASLNAEAPKEEAPKKKSKTGRNVLLGILAVLVLVYIGGGVFFTSHYLPKTTINGAAVSAKTPDAVESMFRTEAAAYALNITARDGSVETITAQDIDLDVSFGTSLDDLVNAQNGWTWPVALFGGEDVTLASAVDYDESKLSSLVNALTCMNKSQMKEAQDAYLSDYKDGTGYELVAAVPGTVVDENAFTEVLKQDLLTLEENMNLADDGCYVPPVFSEDMEEATSLLEKANKMVGTTITYTFGSKNEVVNASLLKDWISIDGLEVIVNEEAAEEYVAELAHSYNTAGSPHTLKTYYGSEVTLTRCTYGWKIDREATLEALIGYINAGEDYTGDVIYSQEAASHDGNDYGNSYVEVNIAAQEVFLWINGELVLSDDVTTGKPSAGDDTPCGLYPVTYKQAPATLRGADYESDVNFWMPFYGDYGLHDAPWKKVYGSNYYLTIGSHGCVNLKYNTAKTIYGYVSAGFPVFVYYLNGTERYSTIKNLIAQIDSIGTVTADSEPVILSARNTYNALTEQERGSVSNYAKLGEAEKALAALKGIPYVSAEDQAAAAAAAAAAE